jgi:hypothetical protein
MADVDHNTRGDTRGATSATPTAPETHYQKARFSLTYPTGLPARYVPSLINFIRAHRHMFFDLYVTMPIPPFDTDVLGTARPPQDVQALHDMALRIRDQTGVDISATYNNKFISPDRRQLDLFIQHFRPLYRQGIRKITIPFSCWALEGLRQEFSGLFIKNTVLQAITEPREAYTAAEAGFDYLNLCRTLVRRMSVLREIRKAIDLFQQRSGRRVYLSILYNEHCLGNCVNRDEHYNFNSHMTGAELAAHHILRADCATMAPTFEAHFPQAVCYNRLLTAPHLELGRCIVPQDPPRVRELIDLIDVFKLHGRSSMNIFDESLTIVQSFAKGKLPPSDRFTETFKHFSLPADAYPQWLVHTRECGFNCYRCGLCESLFRRAAPDPAGHIPAWYAQKQPAGVTAPASER